LLCQYVQLYGYIYHTCYSAGAAHTCTLTPLTVTYIDCEQDIVASRFLTCLAPNDTSVFDTVLLKQILQLERALRAATVQQMRYSATDVSTTSPPTSAAAQSPVRKLSANQAATLAQQHVYSDADDTANAFNSKYDDISTSNDELLLECSAPASGDMCLPDQEPLVSDTPSATSPVQHMRSAARTAAAVAVQQAWSSSSSKEVNANGGGTSPVTPMASPSKTSKSPAIKRGLQAELDAAAEEEAYLKEKEQKRLRNLLHSKPPEGLLNRARDAALSKQEREVILNSTIRTTVMC
jgi:hypothetical protein